MSKVSSRNRRQFGLRALFTLLTIVGLALGYNLARASVAYQEWSAAFPASFGLVLSFVLSYSFWILVLFALVLAGW